MLLTLLGGSVAPAAGLFVLGHLTSAEELRAVLHFNRYCGHLVGVRCTEYFPTTALDAWRILFMADAASWPTPRAATTRGTPARNSSSRSFRRAQYHYRVQAGYAGLYMLPWNRRRYALPSPRLGIALLLTRAPFIAGMEIARRVFPGVDQRWQRFALDRWERWLHWQSAGKAAEFDAAIPLRR